MIIIIIIIMIIIMIITMPFSTDIFQYRKIGGLVWHNRGFSTKYWTAGANLRGEGDTLTSSRIWPPQYSKSPLWYYFTTSLLGFRPTNPTNSKWVRAPKKRNVLVKHFPKSA